MSKALIIRILRGFLATALLAFLLAQPALSQTAKEPEREQLLNGLRLLIWPQPGRYSLGHTGILR